MWKTGPLGHGGVMTNYRCTAACRHCLYACSPTRDGGYITPGMSERLAWQLAQYGCYSIHIGGGEPFMDFDGLLALIRALVSAGIRVEYVETNAYWAVNEQIIAQRLDAMLRAGAATLCISLDPFHAEHVPPERPVRLAKGCRCHGAGFFLWREEYLRSLSKLDMSVKSSRAGLEQALSSTYIKDTARSYGIRYGGRGVCIEEEYYPKKPVNELVDSAPCRGALNAGHYHVDLYGMFVPPCTGLIVELDDAVNGLPDGKYPVMEAILSGGAAALLEYAGGKGFTPADGYSSKCGMCFHIRKWLAENAPTPDLHGEHYIASLEYY